MSQLRQLPDSEAAVGQRPGPCGQRIFDTFSLRSFPRWQRLCGSCSLN